MSIITVNIAKDYTKTPGGRHISEGEYSGEDFRIKLLAPKYHEAIEKGYQLMVILDGGYGYAPSFLEEAFGGLAREVKDVAVLNIIVIVSEEEPKLAEDIKKYMREALSV